MGTGNSVGCCSRRPLHPFGKKKFVYRKGVQPYLIFLESALNVPKGMKGSLSGHTTPPSPYVVMWVQSKEEKGDSNASTKEGPLEGGKEEEAKEIHIDTKEERRSVRVPTEIVQVWPVRRECSSAIWRTTKPLMPYSGRSDPKNDIIHIVVYDYSHPTGEDVVGYTTVKVEELSQKATKTVQVPLVFTPKPFFPQSLSVSLKLASPPLQQKTIFLVRHAKSLWNHAQEVDLGVSAVWSEDHPLHAEGVMQAQALRTQIKLYAIGEVKTTNMKRQRYVEKFLNCDVILSSPLSRAVQTAVVAFQEHPKAAEASSEEGGGSGQQQQQQQQSPPIKLMSSLREKRNFGARDCVSSFRGQQILQNSQKTLDLFYGRNATKPYALTEVQRNSFRLSCDRMVDVNDCTDAWWDDTVESTGRFLNRMAHFVEYLRYSPEKRVVIVGHSKWMQTFLEQYMSPRLRKERPQFILDKIQNCGVVACDVVFNLKDHDDRGGDVASVVDAELLFSTTFKRGGLSRACSPDIGSRKPSKNTNMTREQAA